MENGMGMGNGAGMGNIMRNYMAMRLGDGYDII